MVRRMHVTAKPIIETHEGMVVKFVADNCFAVFDEVVPAIRAAIALNLAFDAANILTPSPLDIRVSCGIDFGDVLLIGDEELFGNAVNRASKLGEDLAGPGEILVTGEAMDRVPAHADLSGGRLTLSISGIQLDAWSINYRSGAVRP
jgi:adenylate cyclase